MTITPPIIETPPITATPQIDILTPILDDILNHLTKINFTPIILPFTVAPAIPLVLKTVIVTIAPPLIIVTHTDLPHSHVIIIIPVKILIINLHPQ